MIKIKNLFPLVILILISTNPSFADEARRGVVQFSNGETIEGRISMTPGEQLKLIDGNQNSVISIDRVRDIRMTPSEEKLVQKWRFKEAGKTDKEKWGKPYPVRQLGATVILSDGQQVKGHLFSTVLYVEGADKTEKVVLWAKQQGREGETLDSLVYPARISFADDAAKTEGTIRLKFTDAGPEGRAEVVALTRGALVRLEARATEKAGDWLLPSPLGAELFIAVKTGEGIAVGWPGRGGEENERIMELVQAATGDIWDFFERKELLGVFRDGADVYSAMLLARVGKTTLRAERNLPWRVEVLRWKYDEEEHRLMLAGRGYFFRGIISDQESPPEVRVSEDLWRVKRDGDVWGVGAK